MYQSSGYELSQTDRAQHVTKGSGTQCLFCSWRKVGPSDQPTIMTTPRLGAKRFLLTLFSLSIYASLNLLIQFNNSGKYVDNSIDGGYTLEDQEQEPGRITSGAQLPLSTKRKPRHRNEDATSGDLSQIINDTCRQNHLGLTDYGQEICSNASQAVCQLITCRSLLTGTGNDLFYGHAQLLMARNPRKRLSDTSFLNVTSTCEEFKRVKGYRLKPVSDDEADFPIAFNILAHENAEQVERLLRSIYRPQNSYCIHVDLKANSVFREALNSIASCFKNVKLASRSERIVYAGYSRLQADINCMSDHVDSGVPWRYLINTAGQAYPLRTVEEMVRILKIYNGANDIEGIYGKGVIKQRFMREWVEDVKHNEVVRTGLAYRRPPHDLEIVRGSAYGVFSRSFVEFILTDNRAIDLLNWSRKTFSPDEHYWSTLHHTYSNPHLHTPGGFSGYPSNKTWLGVYADWDYQSCRGKMVHNVCVFGVGDLPVLVQRKEFFANKFHEDFEPLGLDCLEAWIRHKEDCPLPFDDDFYRNLAFIIKN